MCQVRRIDPEHRLVCIPVEKAIYCKNCENVTNLPFERCGKCGSELVVHLSRLIAQPPNGPDSDPASAGSIVPALHLELGRAA